MRNGLKPCYLLPRQQMEHIYCAVSLWIEIIVVQGQSTSVTPMYATRDDKDDDWFPFGRTKKIKSNKKHFLKGQN